MALINAQTMVKTGLQPVYSAVSASDTFVNDRQVFLHVKNANAVTCNVTIVAKATCNQGVLHDIVVNIPTAGDKMIGPIDPGIYTDPNTGLTTVNYSVTASVTAAIIHC